MILNRRSLLTALGLSLPAFAAQAADTTKKKKTATHAPKLATNKARKPKLATPAQG